VAAPAGTLVTAVVWVVGWPSQQRCRPRLGQRYAELDRLPYLGLGPARLDRSTRGGRDKSHDPGGPGTATAAADLHVSTRDRPSAAGSKGHRARARDPRVPPTRRSSRRLPEPISERVPRRA